MVWNPTRSVTLPMTQAPYPRLKGPHALAAIIRALHRNTNSGTSSPPITLSLGRGWEDGLKEKGTSSLVTTQAS